MELVFNWHIIEKCNFSCGYCFAKWDSNSFLSKTKSEQLLWELSQALSQPRFKEEGYTSIRINFAGGEPYLLGKHLMFLSEQAKLFGMKTSVITNGSLLGHYSSLAKSLNMLGISIDSFNEETNKHIGRCSKKGEPLCEQKLMQGIHLAQNLNPSLQIKFNIVVNKFNYHEVLVPRLIGFNPDRVKILRQLPFGGNNGISDEQFAYFLKNNNCEDRRVIIENNDDMIESYWMINPHGSFFQNSRASGYVYSQPIQDIGLKSALKKVLLHEKKFQARYAKEVCSV